MTWIDIVVLGSSALMICAGLNILIADGVDAVCAWINRRHP